MVIVIGFFEILEPILGRRALGRSEEFGVEAGETDWVLTAGCSPFRLGVEWESLQANCHPSTLRYVSRGRLLGE